MLHCLPNYIPHEFRKYVSNCEIWSHVSWSHDSPPSWLFLFFYSQRNKLIIAWENTTFLKKKSTKLMRKRETYQKSIRKFPCQMILFLIGKRKMRNRIWTQNVEGATEVTYLSKWITTFENSLKYFEDYFSKNKGYTFQQHLLLLLRWSRAKNQYSSDNPVILETNKGLKK